MTPSAKIQHQIDALGIIPRYRTCLLRCQQDLDADREVTLRDQTLEMIQELEDALKGAREALG